MAGTFPGVSGTQQQDIDGAALAGCVLTVFNGGTNVLSLTYQDIGLAIPAQNPLVADQSGRLPLFFVPDGTYHVRLTDKFGSTANGGFDYPQVPSIGASSSGGGGSPVDPTTVFSTGDMKFQPIDGLISGFTRMNGRTVGNAVSGASERANADTQQQFIYLWNNFANAICPVPGGRGANALADFSANKQITVLDMRFRNVIGMSTMGNADAGNSSGALFASGSASTPGSLGGEASHILVTGEMPSHAHSISNDSHSHAVHSSSQANLTGSSSQLAVIIGPTGTQLLGTTDAAPTGIVINSTGGDQSHNNCSPFITGSWYMKLAIPFLIASSMLMQSGGFF